MATLSRIRLTLAGAFSGLGTLWAAAGALKLIFGIRVTFPLFPPIDLERVAAWPAVAIGLLLVFLGAWLQRGATTSAHEISALPADEGSVALLNAFRAEPMVAVDRKEPAPIHRTPST